MTTSSSRPANAYAIGALTAPRTFDDLVVDRGWSLAQYERLLVACANVFLR